MSSIEGANQQHIEEEEEKEEEPLPAQLKELPDVPVLVSHSRSLGEHEQVVSEEVNDEAMSEQQPMEEEKQEEEIIQQEHKQQNEGVQVEEIQQSVEVKEEIEEENPMQLQNNVENDIEVENNEQGVEEEQEQIVEDEVEQQKQVEPVQNVSEQVNSDVKKEPEEEKQEVVQQVDKIENILQKNVEPEVVVPPKLTPQQILASQRQRFMQHKKDKQLQKQKELQHERQQQLQLEKIKQLQRQRQLEQQRESELLKEKQQMVEQQKMSDLQNHNSSNLAYINRLQRKISQQEYQINLLKNQIVKLKQSNGLIKDQLSTNKQSNMELRRKKMELEMEKNKLMKEHDKLQKQNNQQKWRLDQVQKIGDVYILKNSLEELNVLVEAQRKQIQELRQFPEQNQNNQPNVEQFKILEQYEQNLNAAKNQNCKLQEDITQMQAQYQSIYYENNNKLAIIDSLQEEKTALAIECARIQQQIVSWERKWQISEEERIQTKRLRELEQKVIQYESERYFGDQSDIPVIPSFSVREEKDLLLRQFLKLQSTCQQRTSQLQLTKSKLIKLQKQFKNKMTCFIRKKDYNDLMMKYNKAKGCLEGAFSKIKQLQNIEPSQRQIAEQVHAMLEQNQVNSCQNLIKDFSKKVQFMQDKINDFEKYDQTTKLQMQNQKLNQQIIDLHLQIDDSDKLLNLLNQDNNVKSKLLQQKNQQIYKLQSGVYNNRKSESEVQYERMEMELNRVRDLVNIYETKSIILIRQNQGLSGQLSHWKQLYNTIKMKFSSKIEQALAEPSSQQRYVAAQQSVAHQCRQCQLRSLNELSVSEKKESQCQTQNLFDLLYKQIKQTLSILKKAYKEVETLPDSNQKAFKTICEFKEKYQKIIQKYNTKYQKLKKQISENDNWRNKAKQQIRAQFVDIKDLIANDRLTNALRQAKSLIQYYQKQIAKGQQEEEEKENGHGQDMQEQNEQKVE